MFRSHLDSRALGESPSVTASDGSVLAPGVSPHGLVPATPPAIPPLPQLAIIALFAVGVFLLLKNFGSSKPTDDSDSQE